MRSLSIYEMARNLLGSDLCHKRICGGLMEIRVRHRDVANIPGLEDYRFLTQPDIEVEHRQAGPGVFQKRVELTFPGRCR